MRAKLVPYWRAEDEDELEDELEDDEDEHEHDSSEPQLDHYERAAYAPPQLDRYEREAYEAEDEPDEPEDEPEDDAGSIHAVADVGLDSRPDVQPPKTWFLPPVLLAVYDLWETRTPGSRTDPWSEHWRTHPGAAEEAADALRDFYGDWLEGAAALDVSNLDLTEFYRLKERLRTAEHLAWPVTVATSFSASCEGRTWDEFWFAREMKSEIVYQVFRRTADSVRQNSPSYKAKKKAYDRQRNADPTVRAKRSARAADPKFKLAEAERKREARKQRKLEASDKVVLDKV
jgi:hypothetical protein